jgi:hypothetical protein
VNVPVNEVITEVRANGLSVQRVSGYGKVLDARLLAVEGRLCQIIRTREVIDSHYPNAVYAPLYLPRTKFADFLIYVAFPSSSPPRFYVVPRGAMTKDTAWSLESLEQYRDAWQVFKQPITTGQTERRFTILNWQLQTIIDAAKQASLEVTLIGLKKRTPWPTFVQRRAIVDGRKCAVYSCTRLSPDPTVPRYNFVFLRTPTNKWAEFQLCIVKDGPSEYQIYVIPRGAIQEQTTASLDNPDLQSYKSNWKLLSAPPTDLESIAPIEWRPKLIWPTKELPIEWRTRIDRLEKDFPVELRPKITRPKKAPPEALAKTMLEAQSHGLSVELLTQREAGGYLRNKCLYISQKLCQIIQAVSVTSGKYKGRYVPLNGEAPEEWADFVVFFVPPGIDGEAPAFYVIPRARLIEDSIVLPTWIRDYKDAWHLLSGVRTL